jgi:hypothetical protein
MYQVSPKPLEVWKGELAFPGHCARPQSKAHPLQTREIDL